MDRAVTPRYSPCLRSPRSPQADREFVPLRAVPHTTLSQHQTPWSLASRRRTYAGSAARNLQATVCRAALTPMFDWMTPQLAGQVAYAEWRAEQVRKAVKDHKVVKHPKTAAKSLQRT